MGGRESDVENLSPLCVHPEQLLEGRTHPNFLPVDQLASYRIVLAPKPTPRPSRRQIRDAKRCLNSGMVPGAMRKYLMQKKKQEEVDGVDRVEPNVENHHEQHMENNNIEDFRLAEDKQVELVDLEEEEERNHNSDSSDVTDFDETESLQDAPICSKFSSTPKRNYTEAFSPDTTTPNIDIIEQQQTTPRKLLPSNYRQIPPRKKKKSFLEIISEPILEDIPTTTILTSITSIPCSPSTSRSSVDSVRRNLDNFDFKLADDEDTRAIDLLISKNNWRKVLEKFRRDLSTRCVLPRGKHVGQLIRKAVLCIGTRMGRGVPEEALEFFKNLATKYPMDEEPTGHFYEEVFKHVSWT
jgi:hypothetical protein